MQYRLHRCPCDHPITLFARDGTRHSARAVNVSQLGLRVTRAPTMAAGDAVRVLLGAGQQPRDAQVRWASDRAMGLRFAQALDERTVALIRKSGGHRVHRPTTGWSAPLREMR